MIQGIAERRSILRCEKVKLVAGEDGGGEAIDLEMNLFGGDLALIHLERPRYGLNLADACCGLHRVVEGSVFF